MQGAKLNRRVTIQKYGTTYDELGAPVVGAPVDVATVWANVAHISGLETVKSNADISIVKASIRIRYRTDITAGMWVLYGDKTYDIRAVIEDVVGREFIDLACQLGAAHV